MSRPDPNKINIVNGLITQTNRVLMVKRSPCRASYPDCWSFPGGHVELGENFEAALIRELDEELGLLPVNYRFFDTIIDPSHRNGRVVQYHMFHIVAWQGPAPDLRGDEHSELGWFTQQEILTLAPLALDTYLPLLKKLFDSLDLSQE